LKQSTERTPLFADEMETGLTLTVATEEAARCLLCFDAPCSQACPAGTDPGSFIRKLRFRNVTGAIRTIKENNPFGWTCGVVCPTAKLCELACSRTAIDRPIQIGKVQRFLVEHGWIMGFSPIKKAEPTKGKVAVVGSGPAGLTCARQLALNGYEVTVFEKKDQPGGNLRYGIPPFRLSERGFEREIDEIMSLGVNIKTSSPVEGKDGLEKLKEEKYQAVFFSPGLWQPIRLGIKGSDLDGVMSATDFLGALRTSESSTIENKIQGKTVAVIGGGSVALDAAQWAKKLGARDVYILYRRSFTEMPAEEKEKIQALNDGIHFLILTQPVKYNGDGTLESITCRRTHLGEPDDSGRRRPEEITGSEFEMPFEFAIEALATRPETTLQELADVIWENNLLSATDETLQTSLPWIYAGGDIVRGPALVVEAVADGKKAAEAIAQHLEGKGE
jgi:NADPH-dependent glutamate synthase beta subunit-like oxidoreductase